MVRRNKPKSLSEREIAAIIDSARTLHDAITRPLISPQCEHYRSLRRLNEALLLAVTEIHGTDAPLLPSFRTG